MPDGSNGLMPYVAARIAFRSVRNRGTIGGALALADPAADWVTACIALEARMHLRGAAGERVVPAEEFVLGPYYTALQEARGYRSRSRCRCGRRASAGGMPKWR